MSNKWILGSTVSTLMGIFAAAVYLMLVQPRQLVADVPNHHAEWLLWFFMIMVVVSMLVNLSVLVAQPASLLRRFSLLPSTTYKARAEHYQQQIQLLLQLHQSNLTSLSNGSDTYLWTVSSESVLLHIAIQSKEQPGIEPMRLLFRWMLTHQCRRGFYISMQRPDLQAEIFAKEAGIEIIDLQGLQNLHPRSFS